MKDEATADDRDVRAAHGIMRGLADDPKLGPQLERLIAEKYPTAKVHLPRVAAEEAVGPVITEIRRELGELRKERTDGANASWLAGQRRALREGFTAPDGTRIRLTDADITKVEAMMLDQAIGRHTDAAFLYHTQQKVAAPRGSSYAGIQVPGRNGAGGDFFKGLMADPDEWGRRRAHEIWDDLKAGRGEQWLT